MAVNNQLGFFVNLQKCVGCRACVISCKAENNTSPTISYPKEVKYNWKDEEVKGDEKGKKVNWRAVMEVKGGTYPNPKRYFVSLSCNHCDEPACMKSCPVTEYKNAPDNSTGNYYKSAIVKRGFNGDMDKDDGIVYIDEQYCIGCKRCVYACPYGAPRWNANTRKAEKCHLCKHRIDNGMKPACVSTCIGIALEQDTIANIKAKTGIVEEIKGFASPKMTKPNIRFKDLPP